MAINQWAKASVHVRRFYVAAVAVDQRQLRLYSGVGVFTWFYLGSINIKFVQKGPEPDLATDFSGFDKVSTPQVFIMHMFL